MCVSPRRHARREKPSPAWHDPFLAMMPAIETHAKRAFRHLDREAREEAVHEVVCNACAAFIRLVELGKADLAFPTVLARFGIAQTKAGRKVGSHLNCRDVLSEYCQQRKNLAVARLDKFDTEENAWHEIVVEDRRAGPAEIAITRIDFAAWLRALPRRMRRIAAFLARGETTAAAAKKFRVSSGRVSQIRKELHQAWCQFRGDEAAPVAS